jgi:ElaB/YqjD/DUF883 family membrane-anchored ribosome-binding protein
MNENAKGRHDVAEEMAAEARAMAADGVQAVRDGVQTVRDSVQTVRDKTSEVGRRAVVGIEARRESVASGLEGVAQGIHGGAEAVAKAGTTVSGMAHGAADSLASTARYVREHQAKEMVGHVEALIRVHPGKSLLAAAAIGFVAGRALRRG